MKSFGIRLFLSFMWLLHWLPLPVLAALGRGLGALLYRLAGSRRKIGLRNLELCLPGMPLAERQALLKQHFGWLTRSLIERSVLWYGSEQRVKGYIQVEGDIGLAERVFQETGRPTMWLCPHFVGLDVAGAAILLCQPRPGASIYQTQSNPVIDAAMRRGRLRFGDAEIFPRSDSVKPLLRAVKQGRGFFNLPDMDFGRQDSAFVPFFGVPAATLLAPSRLARMLNMVVQPVIAEMLPGGQGYKVHFMPPLDNFPTADTEADTLRLNQYIEQQILRNPSQYLWVHKRFKTRPEGEPSLY
ncbi:lipid A biosynthesis acyltransferase [Aquabacterium lacunae]|uniref:Lipid A biosynthesis acyltransferase n=1 Tax=Aquabacterium lacunae TaxID=2528630 RepID=A0A4Q9GV47_9BURK|nr:lipid A biosynthesis acyltransferase [Aquabacterium lacunae]TBO28294.1 lipid A biosynthesis acyltransferase [Aquabacterium lacunae]